MLASRVEKSLEKKRKHPTERSARNHIEAVKDAFALAHLMELLERMSVEIAELRGALEEPDEIAEVVKQVGKKTLMN